MGASYMGSTPVLNSVWQVSTSECNPYSVDFANSLQVMNILRICETVGHKERTSILVYAQLIPVILVVLILDILAPVLVPLQPQISIILQVAGSCFTHFFAFYFPLWLLYRSNALLGLWERLRLWERDSLGSLCCLLSSILAFGVSLGLFWLSGLYPKFWASS